VKAASAGLIAHLSQSATTLATCFKIKRRDGEILGFTDHDRPLTIDVGDGDGSITYEASSGYTRSAIQTSSEMRVDELEVEGALVSDSITTEDLRAGKYDKAEIRIFMVNWADLSQGIIKIRRGWFGEARATESEFKAELRGLMQAYSQEIVELATPDCRADFGDTRCKMMIDPPVWTANIVAIVRPARDGEAPSGSPTEYHTVKPSTQNGLYAICTTPGIAGGIEPTWPTEVGDTVTDGTITWTMIRAYRQTGTVSAVTDRHSFTATGVSEPTGSESPTEQWWGLVEWLTGNNSGLICEVKSDNGAGTLGLYLPVPLTIQVGDTFKTTVFCNKLLSRCKQFDNIYNFRGEPHVPGNDLYFKTPNA
jgi:hypothetical protein